MNRRDFLKGVFVSGLGLSFPIELSATLTIVDYKLLEGWETIIKLSNDRVIEGQYIVDAEIDQSALWDYLRLVDSEGQEWQTIDDGETWRYGMMEFSLQSEIAHDASEYAWW